jgi:hypothetical protein
MKLQDLTGQVFGRLTVIRRDGDIKPTRWVCLCECGKEYSSTAGHLKSGNIKSCGCLRNESKYDGIQADPNIVTKTRPIGYDTWVGLSQRCHNPNNPRYKDYGAKGITVCDRWRGDDGFKNFLEDMGPRPSPKHSLDRRDNDLGYCKENCRWATDLEQGQNTGRNRNITCNGKTQCIRAWEREMGFGNAVIHQRLENGWSVEEAINTPVRSKKNEQPLR